MFGLARRLSLALLVLLPGRVALAEGFQVPPMQVAPGFEVTVAAAPPLVRYPMMACFDPEGRLYIAESDGRNLTTKGEIEKALPRFVRRLVDTDGDGVFDQSSIFADKMTMPEGGLWHDGALYIISAPYLWRLEDADDDGVAEKREKILGYMEFDGRANQHGPYLGPDGRLYFTGGHFGYDLVGSDGSRTGSSRAAGVFSCWADGSDVRIEGQGGVNPVDVVFTENGDLLTTCPIFDSHGGRHDALIHWIPGGLTQRVYGEALLPETGFRLPATTRWGQVAPAGLLRYRGAHLGAAFRDNLFACHFNTQTLVRIQLQKEGATFVTKEEDFLTSTSQDFHPTDVLEDADGSLLLLDTGGWLSWGCPHSQMAKPQIEGAIYRIRRKDTKPFVNPRGLELNWDRVSVEDLTERLNDRRPAVTDRAGAALVTMGAEAVPTLRALWKNTREVALQKRCLWILSRLPFSETLRTLRESLVHADPGIRQVGATALGNLGDKPSIERLIELLKDDTASVRRAAATALGQIKAASAVSALFDLLQPDAELFVQHAGTRALIEIGEIALTKTYLADAGRPHYQVIALRVLDQAKAEALQALEVMPLLKSPHGDVRSEAQRVIASRHDWQESVLHVFKGLLHAAPITTDLAQQIDGITTAFGTENDFLNLVREALESPSAPLGGKRALLASLRYLETFPETLWSTLAQLLRSQNAELQSDALALIQRFGADHFASAHAVAHLAADPETPLSLRVQALEAITTHLHVLSLEERRFLYQLVSDPNTTALVGRRAAQALSHLDVARIPAQEAQEFAERLAKASPLQSGALLQPFLNLSLSTTSWTRAEQERVGMALVESIKNLGLEEGQLDLLRNAFPQSVHANFDDLEGSRAQAAAAREAKVSGLLQALPAGNASRGRVLFTEARTTCALCHRIDGVGGLLGPDLSVIGKIRNRRDLLEAIAFPNAAVVNGYENYLVETEDGMTHAGLIQRETTDAIYLRGADHRDQRVRRSTIRSMQRSPVSVMPQGFDQALSPQELADLIAYLQGCQ